MDKNLDTPYLMKYSEKKIVDKQIFVKMELMKCTLRSVMNKLSEEV
jgi:hypothetical protein